MGSGTFSARSLAAYCCTTGAMYDHATGRVSNQTFKSVQIDPSLDPKRFTIRECVNSDEHPKTVPVILALDVTGSMGPACRETAAALGIIITNLYKKFKDIEFCVMGIGDLAYDDAPIQMSQFESDVRIAEALDKIYIEGGGGGNAFESYTAAWYMGLKRTKLDAIEKDERKGVIITMGDEPLNPYLPVRQLNESIGASEQSDIDTKWLYQQVIEKFDVYHISVDDPNDCYQYRKKDIDDSFGQLLGENYKISTINGLAETIEECITDSVEKNFAIPCTGILNEDNSDPTYNENGEIVW